MRLAAFDREGYCLAHEQRRCEDCLRNKIALSAMIVASGNNADANQAYDAHKGLKKEIKFIRTALGLTEQNLASKKVKDLPNLLEKAKDQVTIGQMEKLLGEEKVTMGVLKGILRFWKKK